MRAIVLGVVAVLTASAAWVLTTANTPRLNAIVGGCLLATAVPLLIVARVQLGKAFAVTPRARALVRHGLYSKIRHPMYVFLDLALLGIIIALRKPLILVGWLALVAAQFYQASREERLLDEAFGEAYRQYKASTWW